jgi:hypothetical protein
MWAVLIPAILSNAPPPHKPFVFEINTLPFSHSRGSQRIDARNGTSSSWYFYYKSYGWHL